MSRAISSVLALLLLLATALPIAADDAKTAPAPEADAPPVVHETGEVVPGEVIVRFRDDARAAELVRERGLAMVAESGGRAATLPAVVGTSGRSVDQVLAELRADPGVVYAEPSYRVALLQDGEAAAVGVNDPLTAGQYSLDRMRVRDAWSLSKGGSGVVAVLDTGVQADHPDLSGRVLAGRDFVNNDSNAADDNGHGTWVAGIIAAKPNDGYGIAGISWTDKILPVKIMSSSGTGSTADLVDGIVWAADHGATVINMSVGGFPYSQAVQDAVTYAWNKGVVLVGAAGNNNREEKFYPASMANVISVSATQREDEFSHWSSYGPAVNVSAPGSSVQTTNCTAGACPNRGWGSHTYISGTSFATPNVAGVVALIRAKHPSWTPQQVVDRLYSTVDDLGAHGWDKRYGRGRVNAYRALGASVTPSPRPPGDGLETNNALGSARAIALGATTRPTIYPAGDVDFFAVDVPRAGRLDVRVAGVVDARAYPWNKSSLKVDPIVELYDTTGTLLRRVDAVWEDGTELAQVSVSGPQRILVRIENYYANGNRASYAVTPTYVDTVVPTAALGNPPQGAVGVSRFVTPVLKFSEPVDGVSATSIRLRNLATNELVASAVAYDPATRQATVRPSVARLEKTTTYRLEVTTAVTDAAGNPVAAATRSFTTGASSFSDTTGSPFEAAIEWAWATGVTGGCSATAFCPQSPVSRSEMATFLARPLDLPWTELDYFSDDDGLTLEGNINRVAAAGLTRGCGSARYCPTNDVTRAQMASFLVRALALPRTLNDHFDDDDGLGHEDAINSLAEAGIVTGCAVDSYCPTASVTREQMAAFLYRALKDR